MIPGLPSSGVGMNALRGSDIPLSPLGLLPFSSLTPGPLGLRLLGSLPCSFAGLTLCAPLIGLELLRSLSRLWLAGPPGLGVEEGEGEGLGLGESGIAMSVAP